MACKAFFTLLGVVWLCAAPCGGSDVSEPIVESVKTGTATAEVVLQLQYERGALRRIHLAQFRQDSAPAAPAAPLPAVPAATQLCADLCYAGLGGEACGDTCTDMIPVGLATALRSENRSTTQYGEPRVRVCPTLCDNRLGTPLCSCPAERVREEPAVDWDAVCDVFCLNDGYVLGGCPACKTISIPPVSPVLANVRLLDTTEGWVSWCNVQCHQGHGGAACNCDRAPFQ